MTTPPERTHTQPGKAGSFSGKEGRLVGELPTIDQMRAVRRADVERLDAGVKRLVNPHIYHVSLTRRLWDLKQQLITTVMDESH